MTFLELFWSFFQIGLFSIGGGNASLPLIQAQIVEMHGWLSMTEFADVVAIAEITPGPIGVNSATFVGTKIAGLPGAIVATLGCILPSCIIVLTLAYFYKKLKDHPLMQGVLGGLRPAVVSLITSAGLGILVLVLFPAGSGTSIDYIGCCLFVLSFIVMRIWKPNPIYVMLGSGLLGMGCYLLLP